MAAAASSDASVLSWAIPGYTESMENFVVLETVFTILVGIAGLGTIGVAAKVITNLFKSRR